MGKDPTRPGRTPIHDEAMIRCTFQLSKHHIDKLKRLAEERGYSQSHIIRYLIDQE